MTKDFITSEDRIELKKNSIHKRIERDFLMIFFLFSLFISYVIHELNNFGVN